MARPQLRVETLALLASVGFALLFNSRFFHALLDGRDAHAASTWFFVAAVAVALCALQFALLLVLLQRPIAKALLSVLILGSAAAHYYMRAYGIYLDPTMARNILRTDANEVLEVLSPSMFLSVALYAVVPLALLAWIRIGDARWRDVLVVRPLLALLACGIAVGALLTVGREFASLMRNAPDVRYLVTPLNYLWSLPTAALATAKASVHARTPIGLDAHKAARDASARPLLVIVAIGEASRAASWGLDGYARDTTPELAERTDLINFANATSCGTSTEASLPCMFSPWGRKHYDEGRIETSESLLDVVQRAGVAVLWRDNQSGCKRVCTGVPTERIDAHVSPLACRSGRCYDDALLEGLDAVAQRASPRQSDQLIVLHQKGSHGPGYYRRYPSAFRRFTPTCDSRDLTNCTQDSIVNTYDNTIAYTDHVLAQTIAFLAKEDAERDTALLYVSDHGESLGEGGFYLHGLPYAIAPATQTHVPMLMWLSPGFIANRGIDATCLAARAQEPVSHDNLFHTVLGLLDVETRLREPALDLMSACRR